MHDRITPLILTYNEAPNIGRSLRQLTWARRVIVVDSGSSDETLAICAEFANVHVLHRRFDNFAAQWRFAVASEWMQTEWALALDADYLLSDRLIAELALLPTDKDTVAWVATFGYCINGRPLRASLYPPHIVLFRHSEAQIVQDGHAYRIQVRGSVGHFQHPIMHDDRKSMRRWRRNQRVYARQEAAKILARPWRESRFSDRLRRVPLVAPLVMPIYLLLIRGLILDGVAGWAYARQRFEAEWMIQGALVRARLGTNLDC